MSYFGRLIGRRLPTSLVVLGLALELVGRALVGIGRRWWLLYPLASFGVVWWLVALYGPEVLAAIVLLGLGGLGVIVAALHWLAPATFEARLVGPWRSWRRRRYYDPRWDDAMRGCKLERAEVVPLLMSVRGGIAVDELLVHMAPGQLVSEWRDVANRLANALEVRSVRVRRDGPRDVLLLVRHSAVSWRESREAVDAEVDEVAEQLAAEPGVESNEQLAERIVAELPAPTEVHDIPAAGTGRSAFPRRPR